MKFLYIDESGNNEEAPFLVFFALQIDAYKLKKAMRDARSLLKKVSDAFPESLKELKTSSLVNGKKGWSKVDPPIRKQLFLDMCNFVSEVGGDALTYVLKRSVYSAAFAGESAPKWASTAWLAGATSIAAIIQKQNQRSKNNKGLSVVIFDDNKMELPNLSEFLLKSSPDIDQFYERSKKAEPFDHIIDTAFAIKSEHSRIVQISDACAYSLRRKAELDLDEQKESWDGERSLVDQAVSKFADRIKFPSKIWVPKPSCDAAKWIRDMGITDLNKWVNP